MTLFGCKFLLAVGIGLPLPHQDWTFVLNQDLGCECVGVSAVFCVVWLGGSFSVNYDCFVVIGSYCNSSEWVSQPIRNQLWYSCACSQGILVVWLGREWVLSGEWKLSIWTHFCIPGPTPPPSDVTNRRQIMQMYAEQMQENGGKTKAVWHKCVRTLLDDFVAQMCKDTLCWAFFFWSVRNVHRHWT